jgi:hypothetical protein
MEDRIEKPWWSFGCVGMMTPTDVRNLGRFNLLMLAWAIGFVVTLFTQKSMAPDPGPLSWSLAVVPVLLAGAAIAAYLVFLRSADELLRKMHLEGLAFGFGAGFLLATGWAPLERAGAPALDPTLVGSVMIFAWAIGQALARRRYS